MSKKSTFPSSFRDAQSSSKKRLGRRRPQNSKVKTSATEALIPTLVPTRFPTGVPGAVVLCPSHVDLDDTLNSKAPPFSYPSAHAPVNPMLQPFMPHDHPNVDNSLSKDKGYPSDHPTIDKYTYDAPPDVQCMSYTDYIPAPGCPGGVQVSTNHPSVDASCNAGDPLPDGHPATNPLLAFYMPSDHPNTDTLIAEGTPLPLGHPSVDPYLCPNASINSYPLPSDPPPVVVAPAHPSVDDSIRAGETLPAGHCETQNLLVDWMPAGHPNIDTLFAAGSIVLPGTHPIIDSYLDFSGVYTNSKACPYIPHDHTSVDSSVERGEKLPYGHPKVDPSMRSLLPDGHGNCDDLIANSVPLPDGHPPIDPYLCKGSVYSAGVIMGIVISSLFGILFIARWSKKLYRDRKKRRRYEDARDKGKTIYSEYIASSSDGTGPIPQKKTAAHSMMEMQQYPPSQATSASTVVNPIRGRPPPPPPTLPPPPSVPSAKTRPPNKPPKPNTSSSNNNNNRVGSAADGCPGPSTVLRRLSIGATRRRNNSGMPTKPPRPPPPPPPSSPPRSEDVEANNESRSGRSWAKKNPEVTDNLQPLEMPEEALPHRDRTHRSMKLLHAQHKGEDIYAYGEYANMPVPVNQGRVVLPIDSGHGDDNDIDNLKANSGGNRRGSALGDRIGSLGLIYGASGSDAGDGDDDDDDDEIALVQPKRNTFFKRVYRILMHTRIPHVEWSLGNVLFFVFYFLLNILCLIFAPDKDYGRSWGSLSAFSTMLLIIPATRNNVLTLALRIPFDHAVVYHRFLGRFTVLCVIIHFGYFVGASQDEPFVYFTGLGALFCGLVIFATSLDYVRRKLFNVFYWSHYSFVGFLTLVYFHCSQCKPYIIAGVVIYGTDKFLRCVWMLWPREALVFRNKGDSVAQVRFPKNPLTKLMSMHKVGQYYFVNFPALSLTEWHPFSVSSGPREDSVELHIRALGDHTKEIVALATARAAHNAAATTSTTRTNGSANNSSGSDSGTAQLKTWICIDGPYGVQNFNYRRYPMMLLVGGGIGITPVMGMLKDIYDIGLNSQRSSDGGTSTSRDVPHAIETVHFVWVLPHLKDYELFREDIEECIKRSKTEKGKPKLLVSVYITRYKKEEKGGVELAAPLIAGRPPVRNIFTGMMDSHADKNRVGLVFACGPQPLVAELWDSSMESTVQGRRVDFHHEIFDF